MSATPHVSTTDAPSLPATLRLGPVHITVSNLDRSVDWYRRALGMRVHRHDPAEAALGAGNEDVVVLHEDPVADRAGRHAGLYHYALLYPTREELARAAVRLSLTRTAIQGASDHLTHEAIYLPDPDGNGLELAADRPREQWPPPQVAYGSGPQPLDTDALLATVAGEAPSETVQPGLRVGHIHLHVGDVAEGCAFYSGLLGFDVIANIGSAAFVSAGGYHHHLGFNVWQGEGVGPAPEHTVGVDHWTIELDSSEQVAEVRGRVEAAGQQAIEVPGGFEVRDPWDIAVRITGTAPVQ
jgi:catechol 2,3-dioxygenase